MILGVRVKFRIPIIELPFYKQNMLAEWERTFEISFPTKIQVTKIEDISWEGHLIILGFGISVIYQWSY